MGFRPDKKQCPVCGDYTLDYGDVGCMCSQCCRKYEKEKYSKRPKDRSGRIYAGPLTNSDYACLMRAERELREGTLIHGEKRLQNIKDQMVDSRIQVWEELEAQQAREKEHWGRVLTKLPPRDG